jgi:hypothetical protein
MSVNPPNSPAPDWLLKAFQWLTLLAQLLATFQAWRQQQGK